MDVSARARNAYNEVTVKCDGSILCLVFFNDEAGEAALARAFPASLCNPDL